MPRKRRAGKNENEPLRGIRNVGHHPVDPGVGASNKSFFRQTNARIVENPLAMVLVWGNNVDRIHLGSCLLLTVGLAARAWRFCDGQFFNVTNGDLFRWKHLWPRVARLFEMPCGEVQTRSLTQWMADKNPVWEQIVRQYKLKSCRLDEVALWSFGDFVFRQSCDVISSMTKIRTAGFHDTVDTEELYLLILRQYREARILP